MRNGSGTGRRPWRRARVQRWQALPAGVGLTACVYRMQGELPQIAKGDAVITRPKKSRLCAIAVSMLRS